MLKIKYFRKYSRVLLLVFMSLLLVVFLVGDVIGRAVERDGFQDQKIGTIDGVAVYQSAVNRATSDVDLASSLGIQPPPTQGEDRAQQDLSAYLLIHEAERLGVRVSRERVIEQLRNSGVPTQVLDVVRQRGNRSLNSVYDSLGRVMATFVLFGYEGEAAFGTSQPRLQKAYRDQYQEADARLAVIDSKAFLVHVGEPTEEELAAHFEACKDRTTQHTEQELVYGYRVPDKVELEYLTIDPAALRATIQVRERDARRYYEEHIQKYRRPVDGPSPFQLDEAAQPEMITPEFEEVKDEVKEDVRAQKAVEDAQRLINEIQAEAHRPWDQAPVGADGQRQAPDAASEVSFASLQEKYAGQANVVYRKTGLLDVAALRREPGIGRARITKENRAIDAPALAFTALGAAAPGQDAVMLHVNEPSEVLFENKPLPSGASGPYQAYVFRVVRVAPAGPPASIEDVREQVVSDLSTLKAHEMAGEQARQLADRAREVGLVAAVEQDEALRDLLRGPEPDTEATTQPSPARQRYLDRLGPLTPERFTRQANFLRAASVYCRALHEELFKAAESAGGGRPVAVAPAASYFCWVVGEALEIKPIYQVNFAAARGQLEQQLSQQAQFTFARTWFDAENIRKRTRFEPIVQSGEELDDESQ